MQEKKMIGVGNYPFYLPILSSVKSYQKIYSAEWITKDMSI